MQSWKYTVYRRDKILGDFSIQKKHAPMTDRVNKKTLLIINFNSHGHTHPKFEQHIVQLRGQHKICGNGDSLINKIL